MSSVILSAIFSGLALLLALVSLRRVARVRARWHVSGSRAPFVARWLWAACVACCALTCVMLLFMGWYQIGARGLKGAVEGHLATRIGFYTALAAYGLAWLEGRAQINWRRFARRGPKLLPPSSLHTPDDQG